MVANKFDVAKQQWVARVLGITFGRTRARPANAYAAPDDLAEDSGRLAHAYAAPDDLAEDAPRPAYAYAMPDDLAADSARPAHAYAAPDDLAEDAPRPAAAYAYAEPTFDPVAEAVRNPVAEASVSAADYAYAEPTLNPITDPAGGVAPPAPPGSPTAPGYVRPPAAPPAPPVARARPPAPMANFDPSRAVFGDSIKAGGFGSVSWLNTTQHDAPPLVIKVPNTEATRKELEHEAEYYAKAGEHPNLARCYGMQEVEGKRGLVLEGIKGRDMAGAMSTLEKLRTADAKTLKSFGLDKQLSQESFVGTLQYMMTQTLSGLAHLEEQGVVHNDIRPDNIMCDETTGEVKIVDFGLARDVGDTTRGKAPISHGMVSPEFGTRAPLTGKHDTFGAGELARKGMERDQFRYGTDKPQKDLDFNDARAFAQPDAKGRAKRALNPKQEPELLDDRMAKLDGRVQALLADPAVQASDAGKALATAVPQAQKQLDAAQTLAEAEDAVRELDWQVSQAEARQAKQGAPAAPFLGRWGALCERINTLADDPFIKGTPAAADLEQQRQELIRIWREEKTMQPAEIEAALDEAETRLLYDEGRLKKTGQVGAETDYTRFVNWAMNPDPAQRPTAAQALQHPFLADPLLDPASAQELLKKVLGLKPAAAAAGGASSGSSSASTGSDWMSLNSTSGSASLSTSGSGSAAIQPDAPTDARSADSGKFEPGSGSASHSGGRSV
jgi:serine/threonine protein kinase